MKRLFHRQRPSPPAAGIASFSSAPKTGGLESFLAHGPLILLGVVERRAKHCCLLVKNKIDIPRVQESSHFFFSRIWYRPTGARRDTAQLFAAAGARQVAGPAGMVRIQ